MDISFLGLQAAIPDEWEDRSTLTFTVPAPQALTADLRLGKKPVPQSPGNVVISWAAVPEGVPNPALAHIEQQLSALPSILPSFSLVARGDLGKSGDPMPYLDVRFVAGQPQGQPVRQVLCARRVGKRVIAVTGTAIEAQFGALRERFIAVARSLRAA